MLPARIAWRYLKAPKSHGAVSAIAIVSVAGVAVATAAIICVLSVFNGFHALLTEKLDILAPDITVGPVHGKTFANADSLVSVVKGVEGVELAMPCVSDNALAIFDSREMPITLKGVVPTLYPGLTKIDSIVAGGTRIATLPPDRVVISVGVAHQLGVYESDEPMMIFAPKREGRVNMANPMASFLTDSVVIADVFQASQSDYDEKTVVCDISTVRDLFQYTSEATSLEIKTVAGVDVGKVAREIAERLGESAEVKDRLQQQDINFRMVSIEKWVTFLLLTFILIIASFNIISTICMLIIEKQQSMATLTAIGMDRKRIGWTFWWESVFVSATGGLAGIALGLILSLSQQHFGLIKFSGDPGSLVIPAYPVRVEAWDILVALLPILVIGLVTASIASTFAKSRISL